MAQMKFWMWLASRRGLGAAKSARLMDRFGSPTEIYRAERGDYEGIEGIGAHELHELCDKSLVRGERILAFCEKNGIRVLTLEDAAYPDRLRQIYAPPPVLYVRGVLPDFDSLPALAVVGSRRATPYGLAVTQALSRELAARGALIVSGMARGIDSAAHIGALKAGRPTVAVLGCGVDICYPAENARLMEDILAVGAVIAEVPPGSPPDAGNFPARNRIISGLSLGVLVTEAPKKSGSLITASIALEQGRDVFAVPGNIDAKTSEGANALIRDGAKLVMTAQDVLEEYAAFYHDAMAEQARPVPAAAQEADGALLALCQSELERSIVARIAAGRIQLDALIEALGLDAPRVTVALTMLEMRGIIKQLPGKYFVINERWN